MTATPDAVPMDAMSSDATPSPITGILFIAHRIPYPPDRGDKIRSFHLIKALADMAPVHVASFADDARDMAYADALEPWAASHKIVLRKAGKVGAAIRSFCKNEPLSVSLFEDKLLHDYVQSVLQTQDISHIFVFSGQMAHYVPADFSGRIIMDFVDVDSEKFSGYARDPRTAFGMRQVYSREGKLLGAWEQKVAKRAHLNLFVSEAEASLFRTNAKLNKDKVQSLENGIDLIAYDPASPDIPALVDDRIDRTAPLIIFTGQMDYRPNVDAVSHFAQAVMPLILRERDKVQFAIVGRAPTAEVMALADLPGVIVTGAVDNVQAWLKAADIVVAPLLLARGIQNKVLEAMAMAKPVVASAAAAEGIDADHDCDFIVADTPHDQAQAILSLIGSAMKASSLGSSARLRMVERYSWGATLAPLYDMMRGVRQ